MATGEHARHTRLGAFLKEVPLWRFLVPFGPGLASNIVAKHAIAEERTSVIAGDAMWNGSHQALLRCERVTGDLPNACQTEAAFLARFPANARYF